MLLSASANNTYLRDVPSSRLVETIGNIQAPNQGGTLGRLNYVEVNDQYAFFCGSIQLRAFARGGGALVYHLGMKDLPCTYWDVLPDSDDVPCASSLFQPQLLHEAYHVSSTCQSNCVAAHVSSSGKDMDRIRDLHLDAQLQIPHPLRGRSQQHSNPPQL
ncbi:hypothetical protein DEU56DRAFT_946280 [Suillus clintonianus]|uniref:uncharacterized protein n=1 Tax=Suillus clintonianus TaxID=1904413 RepID=UPI001B883ACD|nr:uncharacterized protein DEU56DRAFT_946280 [Suillus clintonianus]KAG2136990.1 hypothetical protein DEU56DRAFT_946280 [Suillus clintonianus]